MRTRIAVLAAGGVLAVFAIAAIQWDADAQEVRGRGPNLVGQTRPPTPSASGPQIDAGLLSTTQTMPPPQSNDVDAGVVYSQQTDGGQVIKFGELDIEGRLKSPALVYFLRRVRAEFAAGDLGHRSFLRELSETRRRPSF
jgi:hypothetical protein